MKTRWNWYCDQEILDRIAAQAKQRETTSAKIVREAVEMWLAHHECTMPMAVANAAANDQ